MALNLTPHPLVAEIATGLAAMDVPIAKAGNQLIADDAAASGSITAPPPPDRGELQDLTASAARDVVGFAGASDVPELVTFTGYLGATLLNLRDKDWCVLYLDSRLVSWLLVEKSGIVFRDPVEDEKAPCGIRDVIWVKADTAVGSGGGSLSIQAQFLTGDFTRAADFDESPPGGGTLAAATGVFCEARSGGCCKPKTPM
jgi:hypothetical protein